MVDLDVVAHLQQLVQARGRLTGIHVNWIIRLTWRLKMGTKVRLKILIRQQDQTGQSEIPL
jgi:hypothetical protein